jgi:hypothetical protein
MNNAKKCNKKIKISSEEQQHMYNNFLEGFFELIYLNNLMKINSKRLIVKSIFFNFIDFLNSLNFLVKRAAWSVCQ